MNDEALAQQTARQLFEATRPGGRLSLANLTGENGDALVLPSIVHSSHDLFRTRATRSSAHGRFPARSTACGWRSW